MPVATRTGRVRDDLTWRLPVAAMIARACAPRSKRAFADWPEPPICPSYELRGADLSSQHFWYQMNALPVTNCDIEQPWFASVEVEQLQLQR